MRNIRQLVSHALVVGGLATAAGSIYDHTQNDAAHEESATVQQVLLEVKDAYGVGTECVSVASGLPTAFCYEVVEGDLSREEKQHVLAEYHTELGQRLDQIPTDPEANNRATRGGLGLLGGIAVTAAGVGLRRTKEGR